MEMEYKMKYEMELKTVNEVKLGYQWHDDNLKTCYNRLMTDFFTYGTLKTIIKNVKKMDLWEADETPKYLYKLSDMIYIELNIIYNERIQWRIPLYFEGDIKYESIWFPDDLNHRRGVMKDLESFDLKKNIFETLKISIE